MTHSLSFTVRDNFYVSLIGQSSLRTFYWFKQLYPPDLDTNFVKIMI